MPDPLTPLEILRRSRPWWLVPIALLLVLAAILVFTDIVPLRNLAYSVM